MDTTTSCKRRQCQIQAPYEFSPDPATTGVFTVSAPDRKAQRRFLLSYDFAMCSSVGGLITCLRFFQALASPWHWQTVIDSAGPVGTRPPVICTVAPEDLYGLAAAVCDQ